MMPKSFLLKRNLKSDLSMEDEEEIDGETLKAGTLVHYSIVFFIYSYPYQNDFSNYSYEYRARFSLSIFVY